MRENYTHIYEREVNYMKTDELIIIFGTRLGHRLIRNGIETVWDLKEYCKKYPYEEMGQYKAICWKGIGDRGYQQIKDYFKKIGMSL